MKRGNQGGGACLEELERRSNVVKATSTAHRTLVHDAARWHCELDGWMTAFVRETAMALVEDSGLLGSRQLDMRNVGYIGTGKARETTGAV